MTGWRAVGSKCPIGRHVGQWNVVDRKAPIAAAALVAARLADPVVAWRQFDCALNNFIGEAHHGITLNLVRL